ncbi:MAG TPA: hypothetical protein VFL56_06970, partial [Solirubrobacterales bacterium]|nr:hypothetical protein [Solirubrobacterales bacterium]
MDVSDLHLADLHARAREAGVPRYRMLTRDQLIAALEGEGGAEPEARPEREERERPPRRGRVAEAEREQETEPERKAERGPEPEQAGEEVTGVLDRMPQGYGFLRLTGVHEAEGDVYVSASQIRRCELRP